MNVLMHRARKSAADIDTAAIRQRIMAAVEEAMDRAEAALDQAPSTEEVVVHASKAADSVRRSRAVELATTAIAAGVPVVTRQVRKRVLSRRTASRMPAVMVVPVAVARRHPVVLGVTVLASLLYSRRHAAAVPALDDEAASS